MDTLNKHLLVSLFDLAQMDISASVQSLARHLALSRRQVAEGINELDRAGLVRADTLRLTFPGLALATALQAQRGGRSSDQEDGAAA